MRSTIRKAWFVALVVLGASCGQIIGIEDGTLRQDGPIVECKVLDDCLSSTTECRLPNDCVNGKCQYTFKSRGVKLATQMMGDCKDEVCDGHGATEFFLNAMDIEDDNNGCTMDSCNGDVPAHTPRPAGDIVECYGGLAVTKGVGACVAGTQVCDAQGEPSECMGQVVPSDELCDSALVDENCNGVSNETGTEGGTCSCGDGVISSGIGEICDDGNVIGGDGCSPICSPLEVVDIMVALSSVCVSINDGTIKCWGGNGAGQLGIGSSTAIGVSNAQMGANLAVTPLGMGQKPVRLAGNYTICAMMVDESFRCWGANEHGQVGAGNIDNRGDMPNEMGDALPAVDLGTNEKVVDFDVGKQHVCAILASGNVKCWGDSSVGQLGLGDTLIRGDEPNEMGDNLPPVALGTGLVPKKIAAGDTHTCVIFDDGRLKCWGGNTAGCLGLGDTKAHGISPLDMGDDLPFVDLGTNHTATAIAAARAHTCAILDDGSVKCWGGNSVGQLGAEDMVARGLAMGQMGDALPPVNLGMGRTAVQISAFNDSTCVLLDNGALKCWGINSNGQLGTGDKTNRGDTVQSMGDFLLPIDLGSGHRAVKINTGYNFACALLEDSSVKCWGQNSATGRLGLGDTADRGDEPNEMGDYLPIVKIFSDTW